MNPIFGWDGQRALALITRIADLWPAEANRVSIAWEQASVLDRARVWSRLTRGAAEQERYLILTSASLARSEALAASRRLRRMDWAFRADASDAAAAVAAGIRIACPYGTLTTPLAAVIVALNLNRRLGARPHDGVNSP